ncbi:uncharacterized protein AC631_01206 [Debaryomyces fabryi]|uniref:Mug135-like C-terminal domain-containing protein n=1 Tax=Debaryomyces fabryi TaxID=58627 RepID=A0A0V1Q3K6_9ASCO|nr:uncharacterized protein AC631_01206 [Debaryomyces fabryi]KSA03072.1 hypothetical protein AC631_01206 [Debaryomyces fabryi]CUM49110.1 unnamed protein product [Debaryomyces fabryi]
MDSNLHSNDDNSFIVPEDLVLDERVDNWYTKEGVYGANAYYCKSKKGGVPTQIRIAKRFFEQVKDGYHEQEFGPPPKVRKIERDIEMTEQRITRLSNYLALDDQDMPVQAIPPDLGDERLNRLVSFLSYHFLEIDRKFDAMKEDSNSRFDGLERKINSVTGRFENRFKEKGGEEDTPQAYDPILNRLNQYPHENGLNRITSLHQINRFTGQQIIRYLEFYGLNTEGTLQEKKLRLIEFLGINVETIVSTIKITNTSKVAGTKA